MKGKIKRAFSFKGNLFEKSPTHLHSIQISHNLLAFIQYTCSGQLVFSYNFSLVVGASFELFVFAMIKVHVHVHKCADKLGYMNQAETGAD